MLRRFQTGATPMVQYSRAGGMYQETLQAEEHAYQAGLIAGARRWGWYVAFVYVLYIPLSEWTYMFLYLLGYLSGQPYPDLIRWSEWVFLMISFPLEVLAAGV